MHYTSCLIQYALSKYAICNEQYKTVSPHISCLNLFEIWIWAIFKKTTRKPGSQRKAEELVKDAAKKAAKQAAEKPGKLFKTI